MEESMELMYKIDNSLSRLWELGDISSDNISIIIDSFPDRLRKMITVVKRK